MWVFQKDGTFYDYSDFGSDGKYQTKGYYSLKNGVLTTLSQTRSTLHSNPNWDIIPWGKLGSHKYNVRFETENESSMVILVVPYLTLKCNTL